ncbi:hypothetical protein BJ912DRAFT_927484 [Pholiota molesta]|nr:hypothetical protein BJ912DRAFT_927484 [Pholiota molesta]
MHAFRDFCLSLERRYYLSPTQETPGAAALNCDWSSIWAWRSVEIEDPLRTVSLIALPISITVIAAVDDPQPSMMRRAQRRDAVAVDPCLQPPGGDDHGALENQALGTRRRDARRDGTHWGVRESGPGSRTWVPPRMGGILPLPNIRLPSPPHTCPDAPTEGWRCLHPVTASTPFLLRRMAGVRGCRPNTYEALERFLWEGGAGRLCAYHDGRENHLHTYKTEIRMVMTSNRWTDYPHQQRRDDASPWAMWCSVFIRMASRPHGRAQENLLRHAPHTTAVLVLRRILFPDHISRPTRRARGARGSRLYRARRELVLVVSWGGGDGSKKKDEENDWGFWDEHGESEGASVI